MTGWAGLGWSGLSWAGLGWAELIWAGCELCLAGLVLGLGEGQSVGFAGRQPAGQLSSLSLSASLGG